MTISQLQFYSKRFSRTFVAWFLLLGLFGIVTVPFTAYAQERLILSVTPPLFQINIGPGEFWSSTLRVVNANAYDLTLYASVMNFEPQGEEGRGKFSPVIKEDPEVAAGTLARWIEVSSDAIILTKESSAEIPFSVRIPENAPPGGHYAAILVGTNPSQESTGGPSVSVSSAVSSLFFVRISGDVEEKGTIREFSTDRSFFQKPNVHFTLRFENAGNVHLQPQGEILITDMWGRERGIIPINQKTNFCNVLPKSVRKFEFGWQSEAHPFAMGRYSAVATIAYGKDARQSAFRETNFWIVPLGPTLGTLGGSIFIILLIGMVVRAYVRRSLRAYAGQIRPVPAMRAFASVVDILPHKPQKPTTKKNIRFVPIALGVFVAAAIGLYVWQRGTASKTYEYDTKRISSTAGTASISDSLKNQNKDYVVGSLMMVTTTKEESASSSTPEDEQSLVGTPAIIPIIVVQNGSGIKGAAGIAAEQLRSAGFHVSSIGNANNFNYQQTVIRYRPGAEEIAKSVLTVINNDGFLEESLLENEDILLILGK